MSGEDPAARLCQARSSTKHPPRAGIKCPGVLFGGGVTVKGTRKGGSWRCRESFRPLCRPEPQGRRGEGQIAWNFTDLQDSTEGLTKLSGSPGACVSQEWVSIPAIVSC